MSATPSTLTRTAQLVGFLLKYRNSGVFTGLDWDAATDLDVEVPEEGRPADFVRDLEALGPTFIKIGQALSTRPDMVPPAYLAALEKMQDDVTALDAATIEAVVEAELVVRLHSVFPGFDAKPLGCASLAQVHRATLRDGREVAVKVQRPNVAQLIRGDLDTLQMLAAKADHNTQVGRRLHFVDWVQEFRKTVMDELDYRLEADHLERFGEHLAKYPMLVVPQPLRDLSSARVLTMELVTGSKVTEPLGLRRTEHSMRPLVVDLLRGYLDQMFVHGEMHADPHPGNLLITPDHRLAIFDLGMVAHIPPKMRGRLLKLVFSAVDGRGEAVADELIALGVRLHDFDEGRFVREVGQHVARYAAHGHSQDWSEGRLFLHLSRLSALCGLRTPPEFNLLAKTLLNLETVCVALDPELSLKATVEDHLQGLLRDRLLQTLSPANLASEAIELQSLLQDAPRKIGTVLSLLAENRLQMRITGWQDSAIMENLQKIANRIAAGIVVAALLISSALLLRSGVGPFLFGYPAFALLLFVVAVGLGLAIVVSALRNDKKPRPREERGMRS